MPSRTRPTRSRRGVSPRPGSRLAAAEAATLRKTAGELRAGLQQAGSSLLSADYERGDHGYAVSSRLADALTLTGADPQGVEDAVADGDARAAWALRLAAMSVVAAAAFVVVRTAGNRHRAQAARRRGRTRRARPSGDDDVGLVPQPWQERTRAQRLAAGVALVAWLLLPVLTAAQLVLSSGSARDDAESSRRATTITGSLLASQLYSSFALRSQQEQVQLGMLSLARQFVAVGDDVPGQPELANADAAAASTWAQVATRDDGAAHRVRRGPGRRRRDGDVRAGGLRPRSSPPSTRRSTPRSDVVTRRTS